MKGRLRFAGLVIRFQKPRDRDQATANVGLRLGIGPRVCRQRLASTQDSAMRGECVLWPADFFCQVGHLVVCLRQRPS